MQSIDDEGVFVPGYQSGPDASMYDDISWDGKLHSYRASEDWQSHVSPKLVMHRDVEEDFDPVTFEVLRNRLWTVNLAHGETLVRISGSPPFQALDFNMGILTEDAEMVMNAPYILYLNGGSRLAVQFIMENLSEEPGIRPGDMFLASDPWIAASHQMDVLVAAPVFIDGRLFAWVANAAHQIDMGGIVPGGWPQNAPDVYSDPVFFTPFKLVEGGKMRRDLELMYRRQSRMPDYLALDLRAQIAGCRFAVQRIEEACAEFGPSVVKATMRRVLDNAQKALAAKLTAIPDGVWKEVRYLDENMPGDRRSHRTCVTLEKRGDRLLAHNEGTDPQTEGPIGFTFVNFSGGLLAALSVTMLHEHTFALGGAERQLDLRPLPGTMTCADYPAAVSGGVINIMTYVQGVFNILGRMLICDEEMRDDLLTCGPEYPLLVVAGTNDQGQFFGTALLDTNALGGAARAGADGVDTGGPAYSPLMRVPNVEEAESFYPLLWLFRREARDSGGAGRWRGGVGLEFAVTPYRAGDIEAITNCGGQGISTHAALGLFGGYPSPPSRYEVLRDTNLQQQFAASRIPRTVDEIDAAERVKLRAKSNGAALRDGDVVLSGVSGSGGFGDPLDREPEQVVADVANGYVSVEAARDLYGVTLGPDVTLDLAATSDLRASMRDARLTWSPVRDGTAMALQTPATREVARSVHAYVEARDEGENRVLACAKCGHVLSDYRDSYKHGLLEDTCEPAVLPRIEDPSFFIDDKFELRRYCCPGCGTLMSTEMVRETETMVEDVLLG